MDDDEIVKRAAEILERRGYPRIAEQVLWAIGDDVEVVTT